MSALSYLVVPTDAEKAKQARIKLVDLARQHGAEPKRYEERAEDLHARPRLARVLERARSPDVDTLFVLQLHDLAATKVRVASVMCELYKHDVRVIAASGVDLSPSAAKWLASEEESHRRKIKRALERKRQNWERTGEIPYGYELHRDGIHLVESSYEQVVLRRARAFAQDGYGASEIARILARQGLRNRAGRPHGRGVIRRWLVRDE